MTVEKLNTSEADALPPLKALRAFDMVGRHLSIRKAAAAMHVTPGAVSQQIRKLEDHLGVQLFLRTPEGIHFTATGRSYHRRIAEIFGELGKASAAIRPASGTVTITVTPTVASKWLIPRLPDFSASHPEIGIRVLATDQLVSFRAEPIDLAIRQTSGVISSGLKAEVLFRQELMAVCAPERVRDRDLPLTDNELCTLPLLQDSENYWADFLGTAPTSAKIRLGATGLCLDAALDGQGVALASAFLVARELSRGRLIEVADHRLTGPETFYLARRREETPRPPVAVFRDWLLKQAAETNKISPEINDA